MSAPQRATGTQVDDIGAADQELLRRQLELRIHLHVGLRLQGDLREEVGRVLVDAAEPGLRADDAVDHQPALGLLGGEPAGDRADVVARLLADLGQQLKAIESVENVAPLSRALEVDS